MSRKIATKKVLCLIQYLKQQSVMSTQVTELL